MDCLPVALGKHAYQVCVGRGLLARAGSLVAPVVPAGKCALLTDSGVPSGHVDSVEKAMRETGFVVDRVVLPSGESTKSFESVQSLCDQLVQLGLDRQSALVAVGGGMVTDLGGFVAGILFRGISWVAVPTTLLGQVDASVGGKTGIDLATGKNLVGLFWQPRIVIADVEALATLSLRDRASGLAEVIKCAVIADRTLADHVENCANSLLAGDAEPLAKAVSRAVAIKANLVAQDAEETTGARRLLNFGHTVGHALEAASRYALRHGESVSLGMIAAARISHRLGVCGPGIEQDLRQVLEGCRLPVDLDSALGSFSLDTLANDKKREGSVLQFVAVEAWGRVRAVPLSKLEIWQMLRP